MSAGWYTVLCMYLTGTETIYDDLWSTATYHRTSGQYTVSYRTDVDERLVDNVWNHLPVEKLLVVDQYFDKELDREVVILERDPSAKA